MERMLTNREACSLQPVRDQVEEVDKLTEDDALGRRILLAQVAELLDQSLDLRRGAPLVEVEPAENALTRLHLLFIDLNSGCLEVDGERDVTDRAGGLRRRHQGH